MDGVNPSSRTRGVNRGFLPSPSLHARSPQTIVEDLLPSLSGRVGFLLVSDRLRVGILTGVNEAVDRRAARLKGLAFVALGSMLVLFALP